MTISVYSNSAREAGPRDQDGASSYVIGEVQSLAYAGDAAGAVEALKALGVGASVAVRHPHGIRSCMNKPALWAWVEGL